MSPRLLTGIALAVTLVVGIVIFTVVRQPDCEALRIAFESIVIDPDALREQGIDPSARMQELIDERRDAGCYDE